MIAQAKAKMFLSEERGVSETNEFRSCNTFNFGKYCHEHKTPFGNIYVLNDDVLDGGGSVKMRVEELSYVIILPVAGAVEYKDSAGNSGLVAAGQINIRYLDKGSDFEIRNPFKTGWVNFLQVWIRAGKPGTVAFSSLVAFDVNEFMNCLAGISPKNDNEQLLPFIFSIGKFSGRGETTYVPGKKGNKVFVFVIEGAFEVEGCLLHARDGLALWDTASIEMEALSNDAIILLIESLV